MRFNHTRSTWSTLQLLSILVASELTVPRPPLYNQDPHDVQYPTFPPPACSPPADHGLDISTTIHLINAFCASGTDTVSAISQPISKTYTLDHTAGDISVVRLTLSWDDTSACARSRLLLSPSQCSGRSCETIFHSILLECEFAWTGLYVRLNLQRSLQFRPIEI